MLEYDRIDLSEGIGVNKCKDTSKKCSSCQYYYFVFKNSNYQRYLYDWCHDLSVKALIMQDLTIIYHNGHAYRVSFIFMSKNDAFNLIKNLIIIDKKGTL